MENENILYMVALPIGNNEDITFRALKILKSVNLILSEDTRKFSFIKNSFSILTNVSSYHNFNEEKKSDEILYKLKFEKNFNIALVSDAGTPMICDPGYSIIRKCYKNNIKIIPIPGISSISCGLSISPFNCSKFFFLGFFKNSYIEEIKKNKNTIIFFETAKRLSKTLDFLKKNLNLKTEILICKDMTKIFEKYFFFTLENIPKIDFLGEFTIIINNNI